MLSERINVFECKNSAFVHQEGQYTYGDVAAVVNSFRKRFAFDGLKMAVVCDSDLIMILCFICLDGVADRVFLVPEDLQPDTKEALIQQLDCDIIIDRLWLENNSLRFEVNKLKETKLKRAVHETQWVLATSGTTGVPRLVEHSLKSLTRTTKQSSESGQPLTLIWGLTYQVSRFAGIQVFLQSVLTGGCLIVPAPDTRFEQILRFFFKHGCEAISATPTWWRKAIMSDGLENMPLKQISLGGEVVDQNTLDNLDELFPDAQITHIYASTEAGVGFSVKDKREGFPVDKHEKGAGNVALSISSLGTLLIKPDISPTGYVDGETFTDGGYIDTGDLVKIEGDRVFF